MQITNSLVQRTEHPKNLVQMFSMKNASAMTTGLCSTTFLYRVLTTYFPILVSYEDCFYDECNFLDTGFANTQYTPVSVHMKPKRDSKT